MSTWEQRENLPFMTPLSSMARVCHRYRFTCECLGHRCDRYGYGVPFCSTVTYCTRYQVCRCLQVCHVTAGMRHPPSSLTLMHLFFHHRPPSSRIWSKGGVPSLLQMRDEAGLSFFLPLIHALSFLHRHWCHLCVHAKNQAPQVAEAVQDHVLEAPIIISQ
jgi:hypothetical protein